MIYFKQFAKKKHTHNLRTCHSWYKDKYKDPIKIFKEYKEINEELNSILMELLIVNGIDFKMPARLGHMCVVRKESKFYKVRGGSILNNYPVDWVRTKELWEQTYPGLSGEDLKKIKGKKVLLNFNEKTGGEKARFNWDRTSCNMKYQSFYMIRVNRHHRISLAKHLQANSNKIYKYYKYAV